MSRLTVPKTYKLFIGGKFPRSESGRSIPILALKGETVAHICHASRKDFREAVEAASSASPSWAGMTGYLRGQILYRMAEMLEARREEFATSICITKDVTIAIARKEVNASIDRLVSFAGWTDKYQQVLGCQNSVASDFYNFTVPEPQGVTCVVAPDDPPLLGLVTLLAAPLCAGNTVVAVGSQKHLIPTAIFGEVCHTSDVPAGVINLLTGTRGELLEHIASHRQVSSISAAALTKADRITIEVGASDSIKRVCFSTLQHKEWYDPVLAASPWSIEPFVEMKTIWHPSSVH